MPRMGEMVYYRDYFGHMSYGFISAVHNETLVSLHVFRSGATTAELVGPVRKDDSQPGQPLYNSRWFYPAPAE